MAKEGNGVPAGPGPPPGARLEHWAEYDAAAHWCASRAIGMAHSECPTIMPETWALLDEDPRAFLRSILRSIRVETEGDRP